MRAATLTVALLAGCASQPPALYHSLTSAQTVGELRGQTAVGIDGPMVGNDATERLEMGVRRLG